MGLKHVYCRECGNEVNEQTEICTNCGVRPLNGKNYCQSCGVETKPEQELCINCGSKLLSGRGGGGAAPVSPEEDKPSGLINAVACCIPIVGLILFLVWRDERPFSAKSAGKWALIGFIASIILIVIVYAVLFFIGLAVGGLTDDYYY